MLSIKVKYQQNINGMLGTEIKYQHKCRHKAPIGC
jgi:hypothetical protein